MSLSKRRSRLVLNCLEARCVPATINVVNGELRIKDLAGGTGLTVAATATSGQFDVTDNGVTTPVTGVGRISIKGTKGDDKVTIALGANSFGGGVRADLGGGLDTFDVTGAGGTLAGDLIVKSGLGNDTVNINANGTGALKIGGRVDVKDPAGTNTFVFGNGAGVTSVGGDLSAVGFGTVQIDQGQNDTVGGSVTISVANTVGPLVMQQGLPGGSEVLTVGRGFNIVGGRLSDTVFLRGLNLFGTLSANLGPAKENAAPGNRFVLSSSAASVTAGGDLIYKGGAGPDLLDLRSGVIHGNATIRLGNGKGTVQLASFGAQTTVIGGNLTVKGGKGDIDMVNNTALIGGNVILQLGNGANSVSFDNGGSVGGTISYRGGNGGNDLLLAGAQAYRVTAKFGSGNDTVTLNNAALVLTGNINGGGGTNTLTITSGTLGEPLTRKKI